jgi:hypothetical protein
VKATIKQPDFDDVAPDASAMIESLRAHGYTLATAIADIVDNSIAAQCRNIWLRFTWEKDDSWISITDDGIGMSEAELVNAMRLGSKNPLEERATDDLGRFGLGLKTASFSQARRLTVATKTKNAKPAIRRWDLDHLALPSVNGWQLLKSAHPDTKTRAKFPGKQNLNSGTLVLLEILDRVLALDSDEKTQAEIKRQHFDAQLANVREHLAMVFHRFLTDPPKKCIKIHLNGDPIKPWDPFCEDHPSTQSRPMDPNNALKHEVTVQGFVLPHRDKFDEKDKVKSAKLHQAASGPAGWNAHQGFYLYRNRRLIIPGDWLGLGPGRNGWIKEEHFKLARIRIDIPNSMDQEWQIDIKKSTAIAPPALRGWLSGLARTIRELAKEVYAHRGGRSAHQVHAGPTHSHPWVTKTGSGGVFSYCIDRNHPLLQALISSIPLSQPKEFETLLRLIEETVPVQRIWIDTADKQDGVSPPFEEEPHSKLRQHILICYKALIDQGRTNEEAWSEIATFPGFQTQNAQAIVGQLKDEN